MFLEGPKTLNGYSPVEDILSWRKGEVQDVVSMGGYIKPAREKRVVRWLSRGIAHIERVKKHARVKNRTRAFL